MRDWIEIKIKEKKGKEVKNGWSWRISGKLEVGILDEKKNIEEEMIGVKKVEKRGEG